ncbi:MAG: O-antigen ligase family protein [Gemmatimonadetes bacterium]|nr:O-antigen ligase family protein [Gemmatimonadota bacterium]
MPIGGPSTAPAATAFPETRAQWAAAAVAALAAVGLGGLAVVQPRLLHLDLAFTPSALAGGIGVLGLIAVVLMRPAAALGLLVGIVYLNLSDILIRAYGLPSLLQVLALPVLVAAWIHHGPGVARRLLREPQTWLLTVWVLVILTSTVWAGQPELADARLAEAGKALALYGLVVLLVTDPRRARVAVWTMVAAGALLALLGLIQLVTGDSEAFAGLARVKRGQIYGSVFGPRLAGPLGDPNFFAQILLVLVPLALFLAWEERDRRARTVAAGCVALLVAGTLLTYSRGGALALIVVVLTSLVAHGMRPRRIVGGALVVLVAATALLPSGLRERLTTLGDLIPGGGEVVYVDSSFEERLLLNRTAWEMFVANPAGGVGAGNYSPEFGEYADRLGSTARDYGDPDAVRYAHSLYLEVAAETGLLGLTALAAALLAAFVGLERARGRLLLRGEGGLASLARALEIALAGYLISSVFLHGDFQRYLWLLLALAAAVRSLSRPLPSAASQLHER